MNTPTTPHQLPAEADVVVVGAGIIGLAHAMLAADRGLSVVVLDRDHRAVGASIRNFGHACITAQTGDLYDLALAGRRHWLDAAARSGFWAGETGAVVVASTEVELDVLRELSAERGSAQVGMLDADTVCRHLGREGPAASSGAVGILGGAFLRDDLRVDPRTTVASLAAWMGGRPNVAVLWNTAATGFTAGTGRRALVHTSRGTIEADSVFVCVGHDVDYLAPEAAAAHVIERCALQMAAAEVDGLQVGPAVLTATSMLRYGALAATPSADRLREQLESTAPGLLEIGANVMVTQRPDGTLLVGDSHAYDATQDPFLSEPTTSTLTAAVSGLIERPLHLTERWQGIYASSPTGPLFIHAIRDGVTAVTVTSGIGMTIAFGLAERLTGSLPDRRPAIPPSATDSPATGRPAPSKGNRP